jgi:2-polyprenyl-3-methyl-5-hydroxy-6-metoxy-1,4-benzoquinol methylase|tara:strand:- start:1546 stop:2226 length:681 start_codon:yes stop_codon:yes gene_type:complete
MDYPGKELENFDKARVWRFYIYKQIKKYIKTSILEVGAGIGSFTSNYMHLSKNITLTEIDKNNYFSIKKKFINKKFIIQNVETKKLKKKYDTIMYLNVLEHIKEDKKELEIAKNKLKKNGFLIVLVPAHNKLYSKFDKAVGHHKRYDLNFFKKFQPKGTKLEKLYFLDFMGYFLYYINKIFFKNETYPSAFKIFLWDKIFTPITMVLDRLLLYKFGKNILFVLKKI